MTEKLDRQPPRYFGPPWSRKPDEIQVPAPVGETCILCGEPIAEDDMGTINFVNQVSHHECLMRSVIGSVGHLKGNCFCFGGTEEDPPGMSRREAAQAAVKLFQLPSFTCAQCYWKSHDPADVREGRCRNCGSDEALP